MARDIFEIIGSNRLSHYPEMASAADETPVFLEAGRYDVFGIHTAPAIEPNGAGVILCAGGSWIPSMNRNRMFVRLARTLAAQGYHVLRYEYRGIGESTGAEADYNLRRPFVRELRAGVRLLEDRGIDKIFLFGTCFGGILALYAAPQLKGIEGVVLVSPPLGRFAGAAEGASIARFSRRVSWAGVKARLTDRRKLTSNMRVLWSRSLMIAGSLGRRVTGRTPRPDNWLAPHLVRAYRYLAAQRVPMVVVWGDADPGYVRFKRALGHRVGDFMSMLGDKGRLIVHPGQVHRFLTVSSQDLLIKGAGEWIGWMREQVPSDAVERLRTEREETRSETVG